MRVDDRARLRKGGNAVAAGRSGECFAALDVAARYAAWATHSAGRAVRCTRAAYCFAHRASSII